MADLVFRRATLDDYDAVLDISEDMYQGMDYIMNEYKPLMSGNYNGFLAELNGKAIAFVMCTTQLNGRKLCVKAGRVREGWRGRGIYGRLMAFQLQEMKRTYPTLETEEFSTNNANVSLHKLYKHSDEYTPFSSRPFFNFHLTPSDVSRWTDTTSVTVRDIGVDGLKSVIQDKERCGAIFPTRVFVVWEMYDPLLSEMSYIVKMDPNVLAIVDNNNRTNAVSTLGSYKTTNGQLYVIQFHFQEGTSICAGAEMAAGLLYSHVTKLSNMGERDLLILSADEAFQNAVLSVATQYSLAKIEQFASKFIAFNRNI